MAVTSVDRRATTYSAGETMRRGFRARPAINRARCAAAWIYAGGPHHTAFSQAVTTEMIEDLANMAGIQCMTIDRDTRLRQFRPLAASSGRRELG
jgi:L-arabinose isomerase